MKCRRGAGFAVADLCFSHRRRASWMSTLANKKFHFTWARVSRVLPLPPLAHPRFNIAKWVGRVVLEHCGVHVGIDSAFVVLHGVLSCSPLAHGESRKLFDR